jgi:hypothetical protein
MMTELDRLMAQLIAEMSVTSEVRASHMTGDMIHGGNPDRSPRGPSRGMADEYRDRYNNAHKEESKKAVYDDAKRELMGLRLGKRHAVRGTWEWKLAIGSDTRPAASVAYTYDCSLQYVYRLRNDIRASK